MRILIVTDSYPPLIGGATQYAQLLGHELRDAGHTVIVATAWQPDLPEEEADTGIAVYRLQGLTSRVPWFSANPFRRTPPPFPDPETVWRFHRLIRRVRPDLIHAYGWITYSCTVALIGKKIPLVVTAWDYGNVCAVRTLRQNEQQICSGPALRKCLACANRFYGTPKGTVAVAGVLGGRPLLRWQMSGLHSCSAYVHNVMQRYLLSGWGTTGAIKTGVFPHFVIPGFHEDARDAAPDQTILDRLPTEPFILFVGALRRVKGITQLLAAYERLQNAPPLVLIGPRAPDTPASFPNGVTVIHDVPHGTVMAAWEQALFGVFPSTWAEPLGFVVYEAMSKGKAVIGTTPGGHVDMIGNDEAGLLVPTGDVAALTIAMQRLVDDPELRAQLGQTGVMRSKAFTASVVVPQTEGLYAAAMRLHEVS